MAATQDFDLLCINTIRTLSIDAVQAANSGHPGTPMALAPLVYTLWNRVMRFDPKDPIWPNRDRFVLSNGHASMLLWSVLHLTGTQAVNTEYEIVGKPAVTLDDIRHFRQFGSKAPGHPEYHLVSGVEATTGPLGQGIAMSVGMAIAERWLEANYNRPGFDVFDYDIYAVCGDGCLMEGVGSEAASLAGHLGLDNLCWIYDNNHITIEGKTDIAFTEDVAGRFLAYGWNVVRVGDANDLDRIENALRNAAGTTGRPSIVIVDSHIGYGSPHRQDTSAAHGEPLGEEEIKLVKQAYGWPPDAKFLVPSGVYEHLESGIGRCFYEHEPSVGTERCFPASRLGQLSVTVLDSPTRQQSGKYLVGRAEQGSTGHDMVAGLQQGGKGRKHRRHTRGSRHAVRRAFEPADLLNEFVYVRVRVPAVNVALDLFGE